jgi:hypothetical protein
MTEWTKTILFVAAAGVSIGLAAAAQTLSRPAAPKEFERVGEEFYPDFQDPTAARTLEVVSYDEDTSVIKKFDVAWGKQGWTISPYDYPADAENQLEKTAASVIGVTRTGLASRREADEERFGVLDPLDEDATKLKGRGRRITLKDAKGNVLADYILGKPVEGREGYFYVRKPKEKETYIAKVSLNLSTNFADWIESDLLKLSASDLRKIEILDYSVDEDKRAIDRRESSVLTRAEDFGPWKLDGLNEATEQVNTAEVNKITRVLDDLKITGVRPKPQGLNPDLTLDPQVINNQISLQVLAASLADKGFLLVQNRQGEFQLVSKEGQVVATTNNGVAYDLYFGDQFTGSQFDLEFGDAKDADKPKQLGKGEPKKTQKGRYVLITARFDPAYLGDAPKPPAEPTPPAADASEPDKKKAADAAKQAKDDYETAKKAYDRKIADAKKRVDDLNARFKKWYYVISAESFQDLRLSRAALVEPKKEEPKTGGTTPPTGVAPPAGAAPPAGGTPPAAPETPAEAPKPAAAASGSGDAAGTDNSATPASPPDAAAPPAESPDGTPPAEAQEPPKPE